MFANNCERRVRRVKLTPSLSLWDPVSELGARGARRPYLSILCYTDTRAVGLVDCYREAHRRGRWKRNAARVSNYSN